MKRGALWFAGFCGWLGALAVNELVLVLTKPLAPHLFSLTAGPVAFWTSVGTVGATLVYALVRRLSRRPQRSFLIVAIIVLVLSFIPDLLLFMLPPSRIEQVTVGGVAALMGMHVVAAAIITGALLRFTRAPPVRA